MNAYFCRHSKQRILAIFIGLALLYAVPFFTVPGNAAGYIKIDGIDGEAIDDGHKDWIEIENVELSTSREISVGADGSRQASKPRLSDIAVIKSIDKSSPKLFTEAVLGSSGKNAEIHLTRPVATGEEKVYMTLTLSNILVSSLSTSGRDLMTESMALNYEEIKWTYIPYSRDGQPGEPVSATYNLREQTQ